MKFIFPLFALFFASAASEPWSDQELVQPKVLADQLTAGNKPPVYFVGFPALYKGGAHIATAIQAGPGSKAEGIDALKKAVEKLPKDQEVFIYCGCCPFVRCPNIRPAYSALHEMGFTKIRVVSMETNLHTDWVEKGYPVEKSAPSTASHPAQP